MGLVYSIVQYQGKVVFADYSNNCIRTFKRADLLTSLMSGSPDGPGGDDLGSFEVARFRKPKSMHYDPKGHCIYVTVEFYKKIKKLDLETEMVTDILTLNLKPYGVYRSPFDDTFFAYHEHEILMWNDGESPTVLLGKLL